MKKSMMSGLLLLAGVLCALPVAAYADGANEAQRLAGLKQIRQQGLDGRLNVLQQERACVMAATSMEALQSCDQISRQMMDRMQELQRASWERYKAANQQDKENKKQ